ncbi:MAG: hypothetical protein IPM48_13895 [Saprospiraceae bacterium]|nr:hypothetical protein [Saprospiraceae bacterium]
MQKHLYLFLFCIAYSLNAISQTLPEICGYQRLLDHGENLNPGYKEAIREAFIESKNTMTSRTPEVYRIPVVFHVVWRSSVPDQNIPDSCISRQVQILNEAFRGQNPDRNQLRPIFGLEVTDSEIEFYLADTDPQGKPSNGIVRKSTSTRFTINPLAGINIDMKSSSKGGSDPWPVDRYLNIWVVHMPLNFLGVEQVSVIGFATPPANLQNWPSNALEGVGADGVVMQYHFIGDNNPHFAKLPSAFSLADRGRSLVHEIGHYLGLRHIWADKGNPLLGTPSCTNTQGNREDDGMDDTPYCGGNSQTTGCSLSKNTCVDGNPDLPDMWENYMDYSEERCQVLFTPQQVDFMRNVIENRRKRLVSWNEPSRVDEPDPQADVSLIPNPNFGEFRMIWDASLKPKTIGIYPLLGQRMLFDIKEDQAFADFDLNFLAPGIYLVRIYDEYQRILRTKKLIRINN